MRSVVPAASSKRPQARSCRPPIDDEPFWGWDRLPMIDDWLTRGGW